MAITDEYSCIGIVRFQISIETINLLKEMSFFSSANIVLDNEHYSRVHRKIDLGREHIHIKEGK